MRILITGAGGMLGTALSRSFETDGHDVRRLVRRAEAGPGSHAWNPKGGEIDPVAMEGVDAVVNLAGANIAGGRWTPARKRLLRDSRVPGTELLARCMADARMKPEVFVSVSGIGYYGVSCEGWLDENSPPGDGFLASLCREWEAAAGAAAAAGVRVVTLRTGVVLSPAGGALAKLTPLFRTGLGGPIGDGLMWMSWISVDDWVRAVRHVIARSEISGPVNAVSPNAVTNEAFSEALGAALHRPARVRMPAFAMRLVLGEMGDETVLASARARPGRLLESGFVFLHPGIDGALAAVLRDGG